MAVSANRLELLQIADAVAREKAIDRDVVITAMEDAIQKAAKSRYGSENEIKAEVDPKTGEISLARLLEVVEGQAEGEVERAESPPGQSETGYGRHSHEPFLSE